MAVVGNSGRVGARVATILVAAGLAVPDALGQSIGPAVFVCHNVSDSIATFTVNQDGSLSFVGVYPVADAPQTIAVSPNGAHLLVAHATDDDPTAVLEVFAVNADATLTEVLATTIPDSPLGSLWVNDDIAAITQTNVGPPNFVNTYQYDPAGPSWTTADTAATGSFNTSLALHLEGTVLYTQDSLSNAVSWFGVGPLGELELLGMLGTGSTFPLELAVTSNGAFLYAAGGISNDGHSVLGFAVAPDGGLSPLGGSPYFSPGQSPAYLAVGGDDTLLFVGHGTDATVRSFTIDPRAGTLTATGAVFDVGLQGTVGDVVVLGDLLLVTDESTAVDGISGVYSFQIDPDGSFAMIGSINETMGVRPEAIAAWQPTQTLGDLDGDGSVSTADLLILLSAWGPCPEPCPPTCAADLDGDCQVATSDLLILLAAWGS
jgi:6-phosphogluconolactonase (cycloisomerase 2 family)